MQNIDTFYSSNPTEDWKVVLGEKMHYHFGLVNRDENPFDYAVNDLTKNIPFGSKVLDCGCGWGGPARYLIHNKKCSVTGITISENQYNYIDDFPVIHSDLHDYIPEENYDYALFIESYCHLENPSKVFKNISEKVSNILIKDYVLPKTEKVSKWELTIRSRADLIDHLESAGYQVVDYQLYDSKDTRESILYSTEYWLDNIKKLSHTSVSRHISILKDLCLTVQTHKNIGFDLFTVHAKRSFTSF